MKNSNCFTKNPVHEDILALGQVHFIMTSDKERKGFRTLLLKEPLQRPSLYVMEYDWKVLTKILATMSNDARGISTPGPASIPNPMKPRYAKGYQGAALGLVVLSGKNMRMGT